MRHERLRAIADPPAWRVAARADGIARFTFVLLAISLASHRFSLLETPEFVWLLAICGLLCLIVLMTAAAALRRAWRQGEKGAGLAVRGGLIALLILAPYLYGGWLVARYPALDDVATDPEDPPLFSTLAPLRTPPMNPVDRIGAGQAAAQAAAYPAVTGRRYAAAPDTVEEAIAAVIGDFGWQVVASRQAVEPAVESTFEAVARSPVIGWYYDIAVRSIDEGEHTYVDMRSASRYGAHDLGANARRIEAFLAALDAEMAGRVTG